MLVAFPLFIMIILIIIIVNWNYDKYSDLKKSFKGYRNIVPEPFEMKKLLMYSVLMVVSGTVIMYMVLMI